MIQFQRLHALLDQMREFLIPHRLSLHPRKCVVLPVAAGVPFLGWTVFRDHRRLRRATGLRFQRRLRELTEDYREGSVTQEGVRASVMSWIGHLDHGDTWRLRTKLLHAAPFVRHPTSPP